MPEYWLIFDVESVGLHGEGFAVGGVVLDKLFGKVEEFTFWCPSSAAQGVGSDRAWIEQNVKIEGQPTAQHPEQVRAQFWAKWAEWQAKGAWLAADVPWPVEATFLQACFEDAWSRTADTIYPLVDIASVRLGKKLDPLATVPREENEMPAHNPLCDARQSARLLKEAMKRGRK